MAEARQCHEAVWCNSTAQVKSNSYANISDSTETHELKGRARTGKKMNIIKLGSLACSGTKLKSLKARAKLSSFPLYAANFVLGSGSTRLLGPCQLQHCSACLHVGQRQMVTDYHKFAQQMRMPSSSAGDKALQQATSQSLNKEH